MCFVLAWKRTAHFLVMSSEHILAKLLWTCSAAGHMNVHFRFHCNLIILNKKYTNDLMTLTIPLLAFNKLLLIFYIKYIEKYICFPPRCLYLPSTVKPKRSGFVFIKQNPLKIKFICVPCDRQCKDDQKWQEQLCSRYINTTL